MGIAAYLPDSFHRLGSHLVLGTILEQLGLIGFFLYATIWVLVFVRWWSTIRLSKHDPFLRGFVVGLGAICWQMLFLALAYNGEFATMGRFWFFGGLVEAVYQISSKRAVEVVSK